MAKLTKTDEFQERIGILIDHAKARLLELKAGAREARLGARKDYARGIRALETKQGELKTHFGEWQKAGQAASKDLMKKIEDAARDLRKALDAQLKKSK
jgi:hypothetical protein